MDNGESFFETIDFAPGSMVSRYGGGGKDGKNLFYEPGDYPARAVFTYFPSSSEGEGERVELSADLVFRIV